MFTVFIGDITETASGSICEKSDEIRLSEDFGESDDGVGDGIFGVTDRDIFFIDRGEVVFNGTVVISKQSTDGVLTDESDTVDIKSDAIKGADFDTVGDEIIRGRADHDRVSGFGGDGFRIIKKDEDALTERIDSFNIRSFKMGFR